jgi:hypothetical protein
MYGFRSSTGVQVNRSSTWIQGYSSSTCLQWCRISIGIQGYRSNRGHRSSTGVHGYGYGTGVHGYRCNTMVRGSTGVNEYLMYLRLTEYYRDTGVKMYRCSIGIQWVQENFRCTSVQKLYRDCTRIEV